MKSLIHISLSVTVNAICKRGSGSVFYWIYITTDFDLLLPYLLRYCKQTL